MATTGYPTATPAATELAPEDLTLVVGGSAAHSVFYEIGYFLGSAAAWVGDAFTSVNNAYASAVEQSNGTIMMNT